jgi:PTH2 family peptidyl-tRNA hydrolase
MSQYKQVIIVRTDLGMSKGKLAAQVAHASVGSILRSGGTNDQYVVNWLRDNQTKIVLEVGSEAELMSVNDKCRDVGLNRYMVADAGHTELEPGTITCLGIGPDKVDKIDKVTKDLRLLK